jgi:hypothetical protein
LPENIDDEVNVIQNSGKFSVLNPGENLSWKDPESGHILFESPEDAKEAYLTQKKRNLLEDALKYEGEQLAHCVGGYCPKVVSGDSRIFSLRDAEGKPYTTIEAVPRFTSLDTDLITQKLHSELGRVPTQSEVQDVLNNQNVMRINQIKGPRNLPPSEKYLPFVQDFVRSGNWSSVGDLSNAGMRRLPDNRYITNSQFDEAIQKLTGEGEPSVNAEWLARQINADPAWWENTKGAFEGFARGGLAEGKGLEALKRYLFHSDLFKPHRTAEVTAKMSAREVERLMEDRAALEAYLTQPLSLDKPLYRGVDIASIDIPQRGDIIGGSGGPASFSTSPNMAYAHSKGDGLIIGVRPDDRLRGVVIPRELNPFESEVVLHPDTLLEVYNARNLKNGQPMADTWVTPDDSYYARRKYWKTGGLVDLGNQEGYANGGLVDSGYNAEHVDTLANQLMEEVYGQR